VLKYIPTSIFYSSTAWLDPRNVGYTPSSSKEIHNNIFLYNDLMFDIDYKNLESARKASLELIKVMKGMGHAIKSITFSGSKGFHLSFDYSDDTKIADPIEREEHYRLKRKELINMLLQKYPQLSSYIDVLPTLNTRNYYRLAGSINCKTGYACRQLSYEELCTSMKDILHKTVKLKKVPRISLGGDDEPRIMREMRNNIDNLAIKSINDYEAYFMSNIVCNLKDRYVIFLRFKSHLLPEVIDNLRFLQNKYALTDFYIFRTQTKEEYHAICIKTLQKSQLKKIYHDSISLHKQLNEEKIACYLRISKKFDAQNGPQKIVLEKSPEYLRTIKAEKIVNEKSLVSNAHMKYLSRKIKLSRYKNIHGSENLLVYLDRIHDGKIVERKLIRSHDHK